MCVLTPIRVVGVSGSLRSASYNTGLLRAAQQLAPERMTISIADISAIPLYNGDLDRDGGPDAVQQLKETLRAADALLFAIPEYNYSIPGVLKNMIDWVSRPPQTSPLNGKPTAIMGAGGRFGTVRAQLHFRQIAVFTNLLVLQKPELMVQAAWEKFDENGSLIDEQVRGQLRDVLVALASWTQRLSDQ